ncbi:unnamed protein product [Protopolystoma xenopodis]|uniref:Uncharacterized protein n=1 Tax=Protopolystoma xenopodis TaxID=117903 RepID=A0A448XGZ6_9PLAT|nr:unnamed protein product [Protopolystoma xenopodis]
MDTVLILSVSPPQNPFFDGGLAQFRVELPRLGLIFHSQAEIWSGKHGTLSL